MLNLEGRVALITGASGGIGSATAKLLHKLGAKVIISGTNVSKLDTLAAELKDNYVIKPCDLSDPASCENLMTNIEKLDILVCNAGMTKDNLALRMSSQDFDDVININLKANFILNKLALKLMLKERYGRIINISSITAFTGNAGQVNYTASKAGLVGMSKSLALEVAARNITVNLVAPGFIVTDMTNKLSDEIKNLMVERIPAKRFGLSEDVANAIAFLASSEAGYITGQTIHVNGGMYLS